MAKIEFIGKIRYVDAPLGKWAHIVFPKSVSAKLGTKARVSIAGTINDHPFRTSAFPTGTGTHQMMTNKAMLDGAKAKVGDRVTLVIRVDDKPRPLEVPAELQRALARSKTAKAVFEKMPPSHRREIVGYISEAKKPETRERRAAQTVAKLEGGWR